MSDYETKLERAVRMSRVKELARLDQELAGQREMLEVEMRDGHPWLFFWIMVGGISLIGYAVGKIIEGCL